MNELIKALELIEKYNSMELTDIAIEFEKFTSQKVSKEIVEAFKYVGLVNVAFLTSNYLNKFGIKNLLQFSNSNNGISHKYVMINGAAYLIKQAEFNLKKFDSDGVCDEYCNKKYVVFDDDPRVLKLHHISDENNRRHAFDPMNYSDNILCILEDSDECYLTDLYEIL